MNGKIIDTNGKDEFSLNGKQILIDTDSVESGEAEHEPPRPAKIVE